MTFGITQHETTYVTLRKGDASFQLEDEFTLCDRASIEISNNCPDNIARNLQAAIWNGWIKPVAHVPKTDPTLIWDRLKSKAKDAV